MDIFFGTDGWRARLGEEMNEDTIAIVAQAFADYIKENSDAENLSVAIGYDTRLASDSFAKVFSRVLSGNEIEVFLSDQIVPTPILSFAVKIRGCCAGVMITASHNPPEYNGVKFKSCQGGPFSSDETKKIEKLLYQSAVKESEKNILKCNFIPEYVSHLENLIDFEKIKTAQLPVLIDSMGGAGLKILEHILKTKGCPVETIYGTKSQNFHGRLAEPIEANLSPLMTHLKKGNYAVGLATDGDADRLGVCLEDGRWFSAQKTILLLADYIKNIRKIPGHIVKTSSVTDKLTAAFKSPEVNVYEVQVGFKYIADVMVEENIAFGGEESGGFGYGMHLPERDGIFSALIILEMLASSPYKKISEYVDSRLSVLGDVFYDRIDYLYDKPDKNTLLPELSKSKSEMLGKFKITEIKKYYTSRGVINGLKFVFEGNCRWLLIRSSETEDIIRFYAEGNSGEEVETLLSLGVNAVVH